MPETLEPCTGMTFYRAAIGAMNCPTCGGLAMEDGEPNCTRRVEPTSTPAAPSRDAGAARVRCSLIGDHGETGTDG